MNHLKFCGCHACKAGRSAARSQTIIRRTIRRIRREDRVLLRQGRYEEVGKVVSVPYTD